MKSHRSKREQDASFDLTPMIDVVMLLIVFFTFTAQFTRGDVKALELPAQRGKTHEHAAPTAIVLDVDQAGNVTSAGEPIDLDLLPSELRRAMLEAGRNDQGTTGDGAERPAPVIEVIVRADRAGSARNLNRVAVALRRAGIDRWKIATTPEGAPESTLPVGGDAGGGGR